MTVTFSVSSVPVATQEMADTVQLGPLSDTKILGMACGPQSRLCREMLQSSIADDERPILSPRTNGFVRSVLAAYAGHYHLRIRPDDVWIAILSQLSFYVNAHAEELRQYFVAHEEKKTLVVQDIGTRYSVDFGHLARLMTGHIHKNVVDSTLVEWILPDFTTTTLKDTTICSILMMSTLKQFFTYRMDITCGIPSITLEGTRADWDRVLKRLDRLYDLGDEPSAWANMLRPILSRFVSAFDRTPDVEFWKHIVYRDQPLCGRDETSGWLTAFCVWSHQGVWKAGPLEPLLAFSKAPTNAVRRPLKRSQLPTIKKNTSKAAKSEEDRKADGHATGSVLSMRSAQRKLIEYTLDGVPYFTIPIGDIPAGYCEVDVTVDDNGEVFDCMMVAGHVASAWSSSPNAGLGTFDTISPAPQWFMFVKV